MEENNLETQKNSLIPAPEIPISKFRKYSKRVFITLVVLILLAFVVYVILYISIRNRLTSGVHPPAVVQQKTSLVYDTITKNSAGVYLGSPGFPMDLVFEPTIKPISSVTKYSADGKTLTATRTYQSADYLYNAYAVAENYLAKIKKWQVTEVIPPKGQNQIELEFTAQKDGYNATLDFKINDGVHALVTITVISHTK